MKLLFVGDVIGKPGRQALKRLLPKLVEAIASHCSQLQTR